jgi:hypothetical protein
MNKELAREILSGYLALNELPSDDIVVWTDFDKAYTFVGLVCIAYGLCRAEIPKSPFVMLPKIELTDEEKDSVLNNSLPTDLEEYFKVKFEDALNKEYSQYIKGNGKNEAV